MSFCFKGSNNKNKTIYQGCPLQETLTVKQLCLHVKLMQVRSLNLSATSCSPVQFLFSAYSIHIEYSPIKCNSFIKNQVQNLTSYDTKYTVNTRIKETGFLHLGSEFLNKIHHFDQGKRYMLPWKAHSLYV